MALVLPEPAARRRSLEDRSQLAVLGSIGLVVKPTVEVDGGKASPGVVLVGAQPTEGCCDSTCRKCSDTRADKSARVGVDLVGSGGQPLPLEVGLCRNVGSDPNPTHKAAKERRRHGLLRVRELKQGRSAR